jgi:hypothetical protein
MAQEIPDTFYLLVHDFGGAYAAKASTNEGPIPTNEEEALRDLEAALSDWPCIQWTMLYGHRRMFDNSFSLVDVTEAFASIIERRERERNEPPTDPNREHRLTAADYGVGRHR